MTYYRKYPSCEDEKSRRSLDPPNFQGKGEAEFFENVIRHSLVSIIVVCVYYFVESLCNYYVVLDVCCRLYIFQFFRNIIIILINQPFCSIVFFSPSSINEKRYVIVIKKEKDIWLALSNFLFNIFNV